MTELALAPISMTAFPKGTKSPMQQLVIRMVLAYHKIAITKISCVSVDMMDFRSFRKRMTQSLLCR